MRPILVVLLLAAPALADGAKGPAPGSRSPYGGVVPGSHGRPVAGKHRAERKGTLSWIGFTAKDGGAEVFLQSIAPFDVDQHVVKGKLVVELHGLTRLGHNVWRPIDTRYFHTPIAGIVGRAVRARHGKHAHPAEVVVRIAFKNPRNATQATVHTATQPDGYFYAYLDFPGAAAD